MTLRPPFAVFLPLILCSCIANPLGGGLVANLYSWDDRNNPVFTTLSDTNLDYAGFFDGNVDLSTILQQVPDLDTSTGTPYLLEVCAEECLYLVLFPEDFRLDESGTVKGQGVLSKLSTSLYYEVMDLPAAEVRDALDQLAPQLLAGDKSRDGVIDYSDLARLDYGRSNRDVGLLAEGVHDALTSLDAAGDGTASVETILANASCGPGSVDTDGDGICDARDPDKDGDLVPNALDAFELDPTESKDDDGDGIGNFADRDETIYFVVTEVVAQELATELEQFMADVAADSGTTPVLHIATESTVELYNTLQTAFREDGLEGIFLIGDVPHFIVEQKYRPEYRHLSDHPLRAFNCPFKPNEEEPGLWTAPYGSSVLNRCLPNAWAARISSPQSGAAALEDLRNYFEKNHRLRGTMAAQPGMYYGIAMPREITEDFAPTAARVFQEHPLFDSEQIEVQQSLSPHDQKNGWLDALASERDIVSLNVHGWSRGVQFQGPEEHDFLNFYSPDLEDIRVRARVIDMSSCSVGKFTTPDYMAGKLLFAGDTLLVNAFPEITLVAGSAAETKFRNHYRALGLGRSFADTYRHYFSGTPGHFFGDPTIRLRDFTLPKDRPRLIVDDDHFTDFFDHRFNFGAVKRGEIKEHDLRIANTGTEDLVLWGWWRGTYTNANGGLIEGPQGLKFTLPNLRPPTADFYFELRVPPGTSTPLTFAFEPGVNKDQNHPVESTYTSVFRIYTNDPISPAFRVFVRGRALKSD